MGALNDKLLDNKYLTLTIGNMLQVKEPLEILISPEILTANRPVSVAVRHRYRRGISKLSCQVLQSRGYGPAACYTLRRNTATPRELKMKNDFIFDLKFKTSTNFSNTY